MLVSRDAAYSVPYRIVVVYGLTPLAFGIVVGSRLSGQVGPTIRVILDSLTCCLAHHGFIEEEVISVAIEIMGGLSRDVVHCDLHLSHH